jgi:lysophospholipase
VPYLKANTLIGDMRTSDGASLRWLKTTNGREDRILVLLGGHTESFIKYAELLYDLRDLGLSIYALDQRGQGFSSRMLSDREKDHIDRYETYLSDLTQFIREVVRHGKNAKLILLGHSLGGAVAAAWAERNPEELSGLILSSPYLSSSAGSLGMFVVRTLDFLGMGKEYPPGGGPFSIVSFEENKETHSRVRHERRMQDYIDSPAIRLGFPTNHWLCEMEKMGREVQYLAGRIICPTLVLQAQDDRYADVAAQDTFCAAVSNCQKVFLQGAYHEILVEKDEIRDVALSKIRAFLQTNCP